MFLFMVIKHFCYQINSFVYFLLVLFSLLIISQLLFFIISLLFGEDDMKKIFLLIAFFLFAYQAHAQYMSGSNVSYQRAQSSTPSESALVPSKDEQDLAIVAHDRANQIVENCLRKLQNYTKNPPVAKEIIQLDKEANACIEKALTDELKKGVDSQWLPRTAEELEKAKTSLFNLYYIIYNYGPKCNGKCIDMAQISAYGEQGVVLSDLLSAAIFMNLSAAQKK